MIYFCAQELAEMLQEYTPDGKFQPLVEALKKFHNFINLTVRDIYLENLMTRGMVTFLFTIFVWLLFPFILFYLFCM